MPPQRLARSRAASRPTACLSGSSPTRPRCRSSRATCRQLARPSAEATALAARLGDDMSFIAAAQSDAFIAFLDGDFVRMRDVGLAAAARCRETNEIFILPVHLTSAGMGALMLGDHAAAEAALIEALEASLVIDDRPGLVLRMEMLASSAAMAGRAQRAAELLGASEMLRLRIGAQMSPFTSPACREGRGAVQGCARGRPLQQGIRGGSTPRPGRCLGAGDREEGRLEGFDTDRRQSRRSARQARARGRAAHRRRAEQQRDRDSAIPVRAHRRDARLQHPQQARLQLQGRASPPG